MNSEEEKNERVSGQKRRNRARANEVIGRTALTAGSKETRSNHGGDARSNHAGAGGRLARAVAGGAGTARGTHHARVQLSLAFRGVFFPRRRRVGSRRCGDGGRHAALRWRGGWLSRGRGDAGARTGVSRRESRWSATSRDGGAPSRERRGDSPCGSRAARGNLPVRASVERASSRVPFSHARRALDRAFVFGFFRLKNLGRVGNIFF